MSSENWKTLDSYQTEYPADSIEWCPVEPFLNYFVCGTYQLLEQNDAESIQNDSEPRNVQERIGAVLWMKLEEKKIVLKQRIPTWGILDLKWSKTGLLGAVSAVGEVKIFRLVEEELVLLTENSLKNDEVGDYMTLSLNWSSDSTSLCVSDNKGNAAILQISEQKLTVLKKWKVHELEAWTIAFDVNCPHTVYSGGDDAKLKIWDTRSLSRKTSSFHNSGVTIVQPDSGKDNQILVGSFDEELNLFDPRHLKTPVHQIKCSGGLWRAQRKGRHALVACIYGGFQIVDLDQCEILGDFKEHASLAYGADWGGMWDESLVVGSCSFYDKKLVVSLWEPL